MARKKGIEIHDLYDDEILDEAISIMFEEYGRELDPNLQLKV